MILFQSVILSGGEAAVMDRTTVKGSEVVDGNTQDVCSVQDLVDAGGAMHAS
ncbi:MAG TPA: hypothetical protein VE377_20495 [Candidatus Dormibacteraeota bacterium]|nr:hypothetical protein [Candidatus Dormibacteraeota bacterium]